MGALPSASGITSAAFFRIAAGCGFEGFRPWISWVETLCVVISRYLVRLAEVVVSVAGCHISWLVVV
jgi:hypothetical protein